MAITIAIDAGHGGRDNGASYNGRTEKDDVLRLAQAVGNILEDNGVDVFYVRNNDEFESPFKKATDANNAEADIYVSLHRNSSEYPNQYSGIQSLVYRDEGLPADLARNINDELEELGFQNIGVEERTNLVVLRRTKMPAVLVEVGFINTDADNRIFDTRFNDIANAIADGILETIEDDSSTTVSNIAPAPINNNESKYEKLYRVQAGAYRNKDNAEKLLNALLSEGFPVFEVQEDGYYKIQVGSFNYLENAIKMEQRLRRLRYNTFIVLD